MNRTVRNWLALQLARLACVINDRDMVCDARRRVMLKGNWTQPQMGHEGEKGGCGYMGDVRGPGSDPDVP